MAQRIFNIQVPIDMDGSTRLILAQEVIDKIKDNVSQGIDASGKVFSGVKKKNTYAASYVSSPQFSAAGKRQSPINLRLSGDMMDTLDVIDHGPGYIDIGYEDGSAENEKAGWAIDGNRYTPARNFLGLSGVDDIVSEYEQIADEDALTSEIIDQEITDKNIDTILGGLFG